MSATSVDAIAARMPRATADGVREYEVDYRVKTDSRLDGPITARDAAGIPRVNDPYDFNGEFDGGAFAREYSAQYERGDTSRKQWIVTVYYSTLPRVQSKTPDDAPDNPVDDAAILSGDFLNIIIPVTKDKDGAEVANAAGDVFEGLERDEHHPTLTIQKNHATISLATFNAAIDTVNDATFFGLGPRKFRLTKIKWRQQFVDKTTPYYTVSYDFAGHRDTWDIEPVERGWYYKDGANKVRFKDKDGHPLASPGLLDASGGELAVGQPVEYAGPFQLYPTYDFSSLSIPTDF